MTDVMLNLGKDNWLWRAKLLAPGTVMPYVVLDDSPSSADEMTLLPSVIRNASVNAADQILASAISGVVLFFDVTAITALQTVTLILEGKDPASGKYFPLATTAAIGGISSVAMVAGLGGASLIGALTGLVANSIGLCRTWRCRVAHSGAGNFTYSLGASYIR